MSYAVRWAPAAERALTRLPEGAAAAAVELIYGALADDPERVGRPLRLGFEGLHSARRGDYRIVYRILDDDGAVVIEAVGHRSDVYRPR